MNGSPVKPGAAVLLEPDAICFIGCGVEHRGEQSREGGVEAVGD